nr:S-adenosyl-L-methionine-dependent methyltransferase [Tanacetum cinerariifolium]
MFVPASPEHVPAIPDQLLVEPPLAPNPPELNNDYLDVIDYDDEDEPYEDLDEEEEDPEEDLEMDLDKEEEDPKIDIDNEEEEEPLLASPPLLSPLRTPPHMSESSFDYDIPVTTTTTMGRPFKGPLYTYKSCSIFDTRIMPPKRMSNAAIKRMIVDKVAATLAAKRTATAAEAAKVARAVAAAKTTRGAATVGGARGFNNTGPATGVGGPNVTGPTVGAVAMNAVPEVRGCSYKEFMSCQPTNDITFICNYVNSIA